MSNRKEYLKEYHKKYYEENKEKLKEYQKEYPKEYKDANNKRYRLNNPDKWKEYNIKIICDVCGSTISKLHKARHQKTNKCKKYVES